MFDIKQYKFDLNKNNIYSTFNPLLFMLIMLFLGLFIKYKFLLHRLLVSDFIVKNALFHVTANSFPREDQKKN